MVVRYLVVLLIAVVLAGCSSYASMLKDTATYLNERQVQSCLRVNALGASSVGGASIGPNISGTMTGFIATGGIDPALCAKE